MLALTVQSIFDAVAATPSAEDHRTGVYVMAGICGLLVSGVISCIKEMRSEAAERRQAQ